MGDDKKLPMNDPDVWEMRKAHASSILFSDDPASPVKLTATQELRALKRFVKDLQKMDANGQRASIFYLADRFLGIKPRHMGF